MGLMKKIFAGSSILSLFCCNCESKSSSVSDISSPSCRDKKEDIFNHPNSPTFSCLLPQLGDLERSLENWKPTPSAAASVAAHGKSKSLGRIGKSVAVMKETADPFGEFQWSMLQMIAEIGIVGREELQNLLRLFLALNSPLYHELILRAFADIWEDVFSGLERTPDLLHRRQRFL